MMFVLVCWHTLFRTHLTEDVLEIELELSDFSRFVILTRGMRFFHRRFQSNFVKYYIYNVRLPFIRVDFIEERVNVNIDLSFVIYKIKYGAPMDFSNDVKKACILKLCSDTFLSLSLSLTFWEGAGVLNNFHLACNKRLDFVHNKNMDSLSAVLRIAYAISLMSL